MQSHVRETPKATVQTIAIIHQSLLRSLVNVLSPVAKELSSILEALTVILRDAWRKVVRTDGRHYYDFTA